LDAEKLDKAREQTKMASILRKATLLRERKKLLDEGVAKEEIDKLLPLE